MMKLKKDKVEIKDEKVCKKCGEPLRSTSKYKYCDNCRRERAKTTKEAVGTMGGLLMLGLSLVPGVKHFVDKK